MPNIIALTGRLGADPRYTSAGGDGSRDRVNFNMAVNQGSGDNRGRGWIGVVYFGKQAAHIAESLKKGQEATVQGRLEFSPSKAFVEDNGQRYERDVWGIVASGFDAVLFGRLPGESNGAAAPGSSPAAQAQQQEDPPPF